LKKTRSAIPSKSTRRMLSPFSVLTGPAGSGYIRTERRKLQAKKSFSGPAG